ncbi:hypothetical protein KR200_004953 [Drosophila serrata]|nr:hypothetical protein KR200_004953 [Drosophila serrata]
MSASVVCVDLSSDSEEESPSGPKRRRLEEPLRAATPYIRQSLPAKLVNIPKASLGVGAVTFKPIISEPTDPLQSMHIPSGITVTKHQKNNSTINGNTPITLTENNNNNNNNTHSINNNVKAKQHMRLSAPQKVAWSMTNKTPSPNTVITPVPSHQVKVTPNPQYRLAAIGKATNPQPTGVVPKGMPVKIHPPVGIGQQQPNQHQQKPIVLSSGKAKAPVGQMLQQLQQQQKVLAVQLQQQQQQQKTQQKGLVAQVQQRASLGQQQQQKPLGVEQQQKPLQQPQQLHKPLQPPQQLHKPLQQPQQQKVQKQLKPLQQPQQQKTAVGAQLHQQPPKTIMNIQQQKTIQVHVQQQQPAPKISQVQIHQPVTKTITAQGRQLQPQVPKATQLAPKPSVVQPNIVSVDQLQMQQQYRAYLGQLQQQRAPIAQVQQLQQQLPQSTIAGKLQGPLQVPLGQQQKKPPGSLQQKPSPAASHQQKTQMAQQLQKAVMDTQNVVQLQSPLLQKPSLPAFNQITHKSMTIQKLPMVQPRVSPKVTSKVNKQIIQEPQQTPAPAHMVQKVTPPPPVLLPTSAFPHKINPPIVRPTTMAKITPVPTNSRGDNFRIRPQATGINTDATTGMSAARTLPFRSTNPKMVAPPLASLNLQGFTTSATPPLRLLATPPQPPEAPLNEPLLLNLPPTTSITPQLTPTTTPPPNAIPAAVQQQQLAKAAAFELNSLPGASISAVTRPSVTKRIQPITVLKKSDEEWRRHIFEQQQQQQKEREQLQSTTSATIVLVESPPTTPPTEKLDTERKTGSTEEKPEERNKETGDEQLNKVTPPVTGTLIIHPEIVDLDALPETPADRRQPDEKTVPKEKPKKASPPARAPFTPEYSALLKLCLDVEKTPEMKRLAEGKLTSYYYNVHESFVNSSAFRDVVESAIMGIKSKPAMVFLHIKSVVDELKARQISRVREKPQSSTRDSPKPISSTPTQRNTQDEQREKTPVRAEDQEAEAEEEGPEPDSPTLDKRQGERIRKLNHTLATIKKRIELLEEADVDLNDEDSSYLQVERYKKRACQIYEKICDLTGESKSASRRLKQAITFKDSPYPDFNRTLSAFVNRMREFPDYNDVVQLLEHCNKEKDLGLANFEMKRIAEDAFTKVGQLLQARRKTDLYETVTHFTANVKDPAVSDPQLLAKLEENNKKKKKISDVLEKFVREQELNTEERQARLKLKHQKAAEEAAKLAALAEDDDKPCTSAQAAAKAAAVAALMNGLSTAHKKEVGATSASGSKHNDDNGEDSEDESESEDEEDVDEFVDNFKVNGEVSDVDSEGEAEIVAETSNEEVIDITRAETAAGKDDEEPPNGKLKIISVSSLNANFVHAHNPNSNPSKKPIVEEEIIILDED